MRGGTCVWRESFWAPHTGPVFHLLHPELFFILKKSSPSKGSVNTNVVYVSINVQWVWLWAHICSHSTSASPQNLHQYVREAPRVPPRVSPMLQNKSAEFLLSQPPRQGPARSLRPSTPSEVLLGSLTSPGTHMGTLSTRAPWRPVRSWEKGAPLPNSVYLCHLGPKLTLCVPWVLQSLHYPSSFSPKLREIVRVLISQRTTSLWENSSLPFQTNVCMF